MFDWLLFHALHCAIGVSVLLAVGAVGLRFHRTPAARHAWAETVLVFALACLGLLALPLPRPLWVEALNALAASSGSQLPQSAAGAAHGTALDGVADGAASSSWISWAYPGSADALSWTELLVVALGLGAVAFALVLLLAAVRLGMQLRQAHRLPRAGEPRGRLVAASSRVSRPFCVGTRRFGAILVPLSVMSESRALDLEAILAHERAHLDAGHGRARLVAALAAPFLYWNPLYWLVVKRMRADAELCADDSAARAVGRATYVRALLAIVEEMPTRPQLPSPTVGVLSSTPALLIRMESLMSRSQPLDASPPIRRRKTSIGLAIIATLLINAACGTTGGVTPRSPIDYEAITFGVLDLEGTALGTELERDAKSSAPFPSRVKAMDDRPVALDGYMIPLLYDEDDKVVEFMLMRDLMACCMGGPPKWGHWIHCKAAEGSAADFANYRPVRVKGQLDLNHPSEWTSDEYTEAVYELHHWSVDVRD